MKGSEQYFNSLFGIQRGFIFKINTLNSSCRLHRNFETGGKDKYITLPRSIKKRIKLDFRIAGLF